MLRTDDGSIRGTVKLIENIKVHNLQKDIISKPRGEGAFGFNNILIADKILGDVHTKYGYEYWK